MSFILGDQLNDEQDSGYGSDEHTPWYERSVRQDKTFPCRNFLRCDRRVMSDRDLCSNCIFDYANDIINRLSEKNADEDVYLVPEAWYPLGIHTINPQTSKQLFAFFLPYGLCTTYSSGDLYISIGIDSERRVFRVVKRSAGSFDEDVEFLGPDEDYFDLSRVKNDGLFRHNVFFKGINMPNGIFMDCPFKLIIENCYSASEIPKEKDCMILKTSFRLPFKN